VHSDIWSLRWRWDEERSRLKAEVLDGRYRFGLLSRVRLRSGKEVDLWPARDALVLKCLALALGERLGISTRCCHLKRHGGSKGAIRDVLTELPRHGFVLKTDVRHYYDSISPQWRQRTRCTSTRSHTVQVPHGRSRSRRSVQLWISRTEIPQPPHT
jgi:RNA-directed DNA polymerase